MDANVRINPLGALKQFGAQLLLGEDFTGDGKVLDWPLQEKMKSSGLADEFLKKYAHQEPEPEPADGQ